MDASEEDPNVARPTRVSLASTVSEPAASDITDRVPRLSGVLRDDGGADYPEGRQSVGAASTHTLLSPLEASSAAPEAASPPPLRAGDAHVEVSSGPAPVEVVSGRSLPSASSTEVTVKRSSEIVRSANSVVDQIVTAVGENSEPATDEIMKMIDAASTLFAEPQKKSQAIAKITMVFAQRLNANEEHMTQLRNLMVNIRASGAASAASASAEGGGARGAVD
eukprot:5120259-Alexandrium_andersonii.AAC.1